MTPEDSQKICVECRALVPQDAVVCPECGYPFEDEHKIKCNACNSIVVADVDLCPVCGANLSGSQTVEQAPPANAVDTDSGLIKEQEPEIQEALARNQELEEPEIEEPGASVQVAEENSAEEQEAEVTPIPQPELTAEENQPDLSVVPPALPVAAEVEPEITQVEPAAQPIVTVATEPSSIESTDRLQAMEGMLVQLTATVQAVAARGDGMGLVVDSVAAIQAQLAELQATNQQLLQHNQSAVADAGQAEGPTISSLAEQVAELRTAVAELADKGAASTTTLQGAVNSLSTKVTESAASRALPSSLQWLDYMFVAIIVSLIFSMGNLLIMAYIARLIMSIEFE